MEKENPNIQDNPIIKIVQDLESKYTSTPQKISEHVQFSQFDNINKIEAYLYSTHTSGLTDAMGREKPFDNIVVAARNIWYRATKRKASDIKIRADKSSTILASTIATILIRDWQNKTGFDAFLAKWGMTAASYGSAVAKFIDRGSELDYSVVKWNTFISDSLDFYGNPQIEKFYLTPAELRGKKGYSKKAVKSIIDNLTTRKDLRHQDVDTKTGFIELYEVHGKFPLSYVTGKEKDENTYAQQMHVVATTGTVGGDDYREHELVCGREDKCPYVLMNLLPDPTGQRAMGIGAVEYLFDAQWMVNHSMKLAKDRLDMSKLFFNTQDENFAGKNALNDMETGDITYSTSPISPINDKIQDISTIQAFGNLWRQNSLSITSTPEAMRGGDIKSGTAYRTQQLAVNESSSLFEEMGHNKDIALKEMYREFVIPFVKRKMDGTEEISTILDANDIKKIDAKFVKNRVAVQVNAKMLTKILDEGKMPTPEDQDAMMQEEEAGMKSQLSEMGGQRFFAPSDIEGESWKDSIDDFEWEVEIDTPSDQKEVNLAMETMTNLFTTLANPATAQAAQTPMGKYLLNKILTMTGHISPLELTDIEAMQDLALQKQTQQAQEQLLASQQQPQMQT